MGQDLLSRIRPKIMEDILPHMIELLQWELKVPNHH